MCISRCLKPCGDAKCKLDTTARAPRVRVRWACLLLPARASLLRIATLLARDSSVLEMGTPGIAPVDPPALLEEPRIVIVCEQCEAVVAEDQQQDEHE